MHRVTAGAAAVVNEGGVRFFVTLGTVGNVTVTAVVTIKTLQFGMSTWILGDFFCLCGMAFGTIFRQSFHVNQSGNRGMGIAMTAQTIKEVGTVQLPVAGIALRNGFLPVISGTVSVKTLVTEAALLTVFSAAIANCIEYRFVAAGTI